VLPHVGINNQFLASIHYSPFTSITAKIDKMVKRSDLGCSLKMSMANMDIKHPATDNDVCFAVRPNLVKFPDLQF
tara:strand:+ start:447 stop:671 length:225 start_codon:yes stop_codon:yes gene_type:complete